MSTGEIAVESAAEPGPRAPRSRAGSPPAPHLTPRERAGQGLAARPPFRRGNRARWCSPRAAGPRCSAGGAGRTRVPELVPVRHGRMMVSPFTFFRGHAKGMAIDLGAAPVSGLAFRLCGDAHLSNFGLFASPERRLLFDINDFDEIASRPLGVGRQASCGEPRRGRPGERLHGQGAPKDRRADRSPLPGRHGRVRGHAAPRRLVCPCGHRGGRELLRHEDRPQPTQVPGQGRGQGPQQRQPQGLRQAHRDRGRSGAHQERPAVAGAHG